MSRGNKCHLMKKYRLRHGTEPTMFFPDVAKQHDVFADAIILSVYSRALALVFDWIKINKSENPRVLRRRCAKADTGSTGCYECCHNLKRHCHEPDYEKSKA